MKSNGKWMLLGLAVLLSSSLPACGTRAVKPSSERAARCHQAEAVVPDWPASDFEAYAIRLLGVIEADRTAWGIERECVAGL